MGKFKTGAFFWKYIKNKDVEALKAGSCCGFSQDGCDRLVLLSLSCWLCGRIRSSALRETVFSLLEKCTVSTHIILCLILEGKILL